MLIRPVTRKIPRSIHMQQQANIPISCVVVPYAQTAGSHDQQLTEQNENADSPPLPDADAIDAWTIARCYTCGAYLNPSSSLIESNDPILSFSCCFCGSTTSFDPAWQTPLRPSLRAIYEERYRLALDPMADKTSASRRSWFRRETRAQRLAASLPELHHPYMECAVPFDNPSDNANIFRELSAQDCPPLYIVLLDATMDHTCVRQVTSCLSRILFPSSHDDNIAADENISSDEDFIRDAVSTSYVSIENSCARISIAVYTETTLSIFDLRSPAPHIKHMSWSDENVELGLPYPDDLDIVDSVDATSPLKYSGYVFGKSLFSLDDVFAMISDYESNIETVLRVLNDVQFWDSCVPPSIPATALEGGDLIRVGSGRAVEYFLQLLELTGAIHPGKSQLDRLQNLEPNSNSGSKNQRWWYAGGKVHVFSSPWKTWRTTNDVVERNFAAESLLSDPLQNELVAYFSSLGERASISAMGIEMFGLHCSARHYTDCRLEGRSHAYFGFDIMSVMTTRSGGCSPLIITLSDGECGDDNRMHEHQGNEKSTLHREMLARSPSGRACAFGAVLRIRTSSHLSLTSSSASFLPFQTLPRQLQTGGGMHGNCASSSFQTNLWYMGSCDASAAFNFDLKLEKEFADQQSSLDEGEYSGQLPCLQCVFVFTAIIPRTDTEANGDPGEANNETTERLGWRTVRRMRIYTLVFPVATDVEVFSQSLDLEALAVASLSSSHV